MKRIIQFSTAIAVFMTSGCIFMSPAGLDLRLNLQRGERYMIIADVTQSMDQKFGEMEVSTTTRVKTFSVFHVIDIDAEGIYKIKETYDRIIFSTDAGLVHLEYDSDEPQEDLHPALAGLKGLAGSEIMIRISPKGEVLEMKGAAQMLNRMIEGMEAGDSEVAHAFLEGFKAGFRESFSEEALNRAMAQQFAYLPSKPIKVGDTWNSGLELDMGMPIKFSGHYRLESREEGVAVVRTNSVVFSDSQNIDADDSPINGIMSMNGDMSGVFNIDEKSGLVKEGKLSGIISGKIETSVIPGADPVTLPIEISISISSQMYRMN